MPRTPAARTAAASPKAAAFFIAFLLFSLYMNFIQMCFFFYIIHILEFTSIDFIVFSFFQRIFPDSSRQTPPYTTSPVKTFPDGSEENSIFFPDAGWRKDNLYAHN